MPLTVPPPIPGQPDPSQGQAHSTPIQVTPAPLAVGVDQASKIIGIGTTLTWRLIRDKKLKAVKIYGRTVVPVAEIEAFLNQNAG